MLWLGNRSVTKFVVNCQLKQQILLNPATVSKKIVTKKIPKVVVVVGGAKVGRVAILAVVVLVVVVVVVVVKALGQSLF